MLTRLQHCSPLNSWVNNHQRLLNESRKMLFKQSGEKAKLEIIFTYKNK